MNLLIHGAPNKALHRKNPPSLRYGGFSGELKRYASYGEI